MRKRIKSFLTPWNLLIIVLLIGALFVRVYRIDKILGFYYDQGRDGLVIWDLIHNGKMFLIGPTTGLPGIFRGPYYYYLIAPFYWLGRGNPVWPSVFLSFTTVVAIWIMYTLAKNLEGKAAAIFAVALAAFSLNVQGASVWLSNPTPMLILSMFLVWGMVKVTEGKKWGWPIIALTAGLSLFNFGSSGEFFYFLGIFIFLIWTIRRQGFGGRSSLNWKIVLVSLFVFSLTFLPLVLFDFKHGHILLNNFLGTFGTGSGSFQIPSLAFIKERSFLYWDIFTNKIFQSKGPAEKLALLIFSFSFLAFLPRLWKNAKTKILLILLGSAIFGLYFYQGNYGILYDYYMTGYYLIFVLLFGIVLGHLWRYKAGKIFIFYLLVLFLLNNVPVLWSRINDGCDGPTSICLLNQKQAIDWIYKDAAGRDFNVDEYVPPVIPYAYNYLFTWLGETKYHKLPVTEQIPRLYTLYEVDPPHPERLEAWLKRQEGIGKVIKEQRYGGIVVQERVRL